MRLSEPRIAPVPEAEWTEDQRKVLEPFVAQGRLYNIFATLARNPKALRAFLAWGTYTLNQSSLNPREREMVILRTGFLCKSGYEWAQHVRIGKHAGLTETEIANIKIGPDADAWSAQEATLLRAADELHQNHFISDVTWKTLSGFMTETQRMDLVFLVGQYTQVSMILNTFGVQLDEGLTPDPDLRA
ncbi:MAG TPA: carboxymuconolactone decarboxylase family protein [Bryobacteraceae bacterium]|nr:carboxymuconolactone decarboxylase family protein [Bryobacteraceae bacterium]